MAKPRNPTLSFGFQDPTTGDFGRLASTLLGMAEAEIDERQSRARFMVIPSLLFYLLFSFGIGVLLWGLGFELRPVPMAVVSSLAFLVMAGLGKHYEDEADWSGAADAGMGEGCVGCPQGGSRHSSARTQTEPPAFRNDKQKSLHHLPVSCGTGFVAPALVVTVRGLTASGWPSDRCSPSQSIQGGYS